jgi:hypothetical protein
MRKKTYLKNVGVLLSEEQFDQLVWITDGKEMTMSEYIRNAIKLKMDSDMRKMKEKRLMKGDIENV